MRRFLLPASTMIGALVVLLAGALSDPAWYSGMPGLADQNLPAADDQPSAAEPAPAAPVQPRAPPPQSAGMPTAPALPNEKSARGALPRHVAQRMQRGRQPRSQAANVYVTRSRHGTWLFAPNTNGGTNS